MNEVPDHRYRGSTSVPRWRDVFPWAAELSPRFVDWDRGVDDGVVDARVVSTFTTERAIKSFGSVPLRELFPWLPLDARLEEFNFDARVLNRLRIRGATGFGYFSGETVVGIASWQGIGIGATTNFIRALVDATIRRARSSPSAFEALSRHSAEEAEPPWQSELISNLVTIARWYRLLGLEAEPLLEQSDLTALDPSVVRHARAQVLAFRPNDLLPPLGAGIEASALAVEEALDGLDEREAEIIRDRVVADVPARLDELGRRMGVTRERVRQLETRAKASLAIAVTGGELGDLASAIREAVGVVLPLRQLLRSFPSLSAQVGSLDQPVWRILDRLDDAYEIERGWCAAPTLDAAIQLTRNHVAGLADANGLIARPSIPELSGIEFSDEWLTECGLVIVADRVFVGNPAIGDRAAAILDASAEPLTSEEIFDKLGAERTIQSLRNALGSDSRFARVDRDRWALADWGVEGYLPIRELIGREIDGSEGQLRLADLVESLTSKYTISGRSVVAYAAAYPFVTQAGVVRRQRDSERRPAASKSVALARGVFRVDGALKVRFTVTNEHLRGSGSAVPNAVGAFFDMTPGDVRELESLQGPQPVSWKGTQVTVGSIRRFLVGAHIGDSYFHVFSADGNYTLERVSGATTIEGQVGALTGGPLEFATFVQTLGPRIDVDDQSIDRLIASFRRRGDAEVADLLLAARPALIQSEAGPTSANDRPPDRTPTISASEGNRAKIVELVEYLLQTGRDWQLRLGSHASGSWEVAARVGFEGDTSLSLVEHGGAFPVGAATLGWRDHAGGGYLQVFPAGADLRTIVRSLDRTLEWLGIDGGATVELSPATEALRQYLRVEWSA